MKKKINEYFAQFENSKLSMHVLSEKLLKEEIPFQLFCLLTQYIFIDKAIQCWGCSPALKKLQCKTLQSALNLFEGSNLDINLNTQLIL